MNLNSMAKDFQKLYPGDNTFKSLSRNLKAKKIIAVFSDYKKDLKKLTCLDYGCSVGLMSESFAKDFGKVWGIDVDAKAINAAKKRNLKRNLDYRLTNDEKIPFADNYFDVAVFNQVYEHVNNPSLSVSEIERVLKPGGVCYFGARNKYFPMDGHYPIPFLSLLPIKVADFLMRNILRKKNYDIRLFSLWELKNLVKEFKVVDYTFKVFDTPKKFHLSPWLKLMLPFAYILYFLIPNYVWLLEKQK